MLVSSWAGLVLAADTNTFMMSTVYTMTRTPDLLPGTLDLLILRTLQKDALHGWAAAPSITTSPRRAAVNSRSKRGNGSAWQTPSAA